jgi:putative transposase
MGDGCIGLAVDDPAVGRPLLGEVPKPWLHFEQRVGRSWRADETYIKVNGGWMFLYRAIDERGRTVERI